ncbi:MAG: sugar transporter substrate-binding protein [Microbacteriaceae bacterium]|nr:sugar transporter substrate-binding protein [Microbacteriaceae bacterium]
MRHSTSVRRGATALLATALLGAGLVACSSGGGTSSGGDDVDAALARGGSLTYWSWTPQAPAQVKAFEKAYPKVKVTLVNAGTNTTEYTKLQNAIKAGSGAPDVAQIEYYAVPQFVLGHSLVDLTRYGFDALEKDYTPGPWSSVSIDGGLYGLPEDSGPMAMFYNKEVFDRYELQPPTTWAEYVADARIIHAGDPNTYITSDTGDAGFTESMIWQAGGHPFTVKGDDVTIDLQDAGTTRWADTWNQLVQGRLVAPISAWTDDWYTALGDGRIATLVTGAWMPGVLESSVAAGSGAWRVAPMPNYGDTVSNAENGGSSEAVLKQSRNPALAAGFVKWLNHSTQGVKLFLSGAGFPSTTADLASKAFLDETPAYFGGQKINEVLARGARTVSKGWTFLPYTVYAHSVFGDDVGAQYAKAGDLNVGLRAWQQSLVKYGKAQGFTVSAR